MQLTKEHVNDYLYTLIGNHELVEKWWESYNLAFDAEPIAVWETEPEKIVQYLAGFTE